LLSQFQTVIDARQLAFAGGMGRPRTSSIIAPCERILHVFDHRSAFACSGGSKALPPTWVLIFIEKPKRGYVEQASSFSVSSRVIASRSSPRQLQVRHFPDEGTFCDR
jgi:hypothetical protein